MKTKNNVQKTILRSAAVIISFVLISLTVSAQDFWKRLLENSSFNEIAIAMVESNKTSSDTETSVKNFNFTYLEEEIEPSMVLENWMSDESNFEVMGLQQIEENKRDLEPKTFKNNLIKVNEIEESKLELENWMISEKVWEL